VGEGIGGAFVELGRGCEGIGEVRHCALMFGEWLLEDWIESWGGDVDVGLEFLFRCLVRKAAN
jgi:hypothetical protein